MLIFLSFKFNFFIFPLFSFIESPHYLCYIIYKNTAQRHSAMPDNGEREMANIDIISKLISYINLIKESRGITDNQLSQLCTEKGHPVSANTIRTMFRTPSSVRVTTLLNVSDSLDLNLRAVFHLIELANTSEGESHGLTYDVKEQTFQPYIGKFHAFFLPTQASSKSADEDFDETLSDEDKKHVTAAERSDNEYKLARTHKYPLHGTIEFRDKYGMGECTATLVIDTGDLYPETHEPVKKVYEGPLISSVHDVMFCKLVSDKLGDTWSLVFRHSSLNTKKLICTMGVAATASSGPTRLPTIHRFCLVNATTYRTVSPEKRLALRGILRVQGDHVTISKDEVEQFLQMDGLDENFKKNLSNYLNIAETYYRIPKSILSEQVDPIIYAQTIASLCDHSTLARAYHIKDQDNTLLTDLLKTAKKKPTAKSDK